MEISNVCGEFNHQIAVATVVCCGDLHTLVECSLLVV